MRERRTAAWLAAALALALLVRLGAIAATPHLPLVSDPADYARHARSIAAGDGYPTSIVPGGGPTAIRPPGLPLFLAPIFAVTGDSVTAGRIAVALLGVLIVLLIALIALETFGPRTAVVAAVVAACYPPLVLRGITLWSEPLFLVFMLAAVIAVLRWRAAPRTRSVIAAGALAGLAILTRQNGALLLIPLAVAVHRGSWRSARSYRTPALLIACAALVVVPWTVRNAAVMNAFVPVSDQDGFTLAGTYNATSRAKYDAAWITPTLDPHVRQIVLSSAGQGELAIDGRLRTDARRFALDHPAYVAKVAGTNILRLLGLIDWNRQRQSVRITMGLGPRWADLGTIGFLPFLLLAAVGIAMGGLRRAPPWLWAVPLLMATTVFVVAYDRFRTPIDPFVILLAAYAVTAARAGSPRCRSPRRPAAPDLGARAARTARRSP